ncbi:MAG TPA: hypothetical protein VN397_01900 [Candidatus Methylomirabilis sp.]|nr:hypothetical protein [Candidatus Methylomirabilis sp.]
MTVRSLIVPFGLIAAFAIGFGTGFNSGRSAVPPPGVEPVRHSVDVAIDQPRDLHYEQSDQERTINRFLLLEGTYTAPYVVEREWFTPVPSERVEL